MARGIAASSAAVIVVTGCDISVPRIRAEFVLRAMSAMGHGASLVREIADAVGLDTAGGDPHARIQLSQLDDLYDEGARRTGDHAFGLHAAEHSHPHMLDLVGYALVNGPSLVDGFERLRPYLRMLHGPEELTLRVDDGSARFTYRTTDWGHCPSRHRSEAYVGMVLRMAQVALGRDETPSAVAFLHPEPPDTSEHERIFGSPVYFDRPANEIAFDPALLDRPLAGADPGLYTLLGRYIHELSSHAAPSEDDTAAARVRRLIPGLLREGQHAMSRVAKRLSMSTRTLQRRLQAEGTSYHAIVDDARRELALRYLRESDLPIGHIADLLGYTTVGAFYDAFHRWTSVTPRHYRLAKTPHELTG